MLLYYFYHKIWSKLCVLPDLRDDSSENYYQWPTHTHVVLNIPAYIFSWSMKHVTKENEGWNLRCVSCLTGLALTCCIIEIQLNVFSSIRHSGDIFVEHRWSVFLLNIKIKSDKYRNIMVHEKLLFLQYTLKSRRWQKPELLSGSGKTCWGYCVKKKKWLLYILQCFLLWNMFQSFECGLMVISVTF